MIKNQRAGANTTFSGGLSRLITSNPFVASVVKAFTYASLHSTHAPRVLTAESVVKQRVSEENIGLMLEVFNSANTFVSSGMTLDEETVNTFLVTLATELNDNEVIYRKGNVADPKVFDFGMTLQWNATHRMRCVRSAKNVWNTTKSVDVTNPITGEITKKEEVVVRNPFGWEITFTPNEYKSSFVTSDDATAAIAAIELTCL